MTWRLRALSSPWAKQRRRIVQASGTDAIHEGMAQEHKFYEAGKANAREKSTPAISDIQH